MGLGAPYTWSNPHGVDLTRPYLYLIRITSGAKEYRYVGKDSSASRMDAYARNVERILAGKTKRPATKRNGEPQSVGNTKYRCVHLVLAVAVRRGWKIEHYPLENCSREEHTTLERLRKQESACNMNDGPSWFIEDFEAMAASLE